MPLFVKRLWAGDVPLATAFWRFGVLYGVLVNVTTSALFLTLATRDTAAAVLIAAYLLPVPYNLFVLVAVWRSARRYPGPAIWAETARVAVVVLAIAFSVT